MKKFNKMSEKQMSHVDGGIAIVGLLLAGLGILGFGAASCAAVWGIDQAVDKKA